MVLIPSQVFTGERMPKQGAEVMDVAAVPGDGFESPVEFPGLASRQLPAIPRAGRRS